MRVYGEAFFLINGWMNFLSLLLAARMASRRFQVGKSVAASGLGAVYAVAAWTAGTPVLRGFPILLTMALFMSLIAFGKRCLPMTPLVLAAGWLLSGLSDFAMKRGAEAGQVLWISGGAALTVCVLTRRIRTDAEEKLLLTVRYRDGQTTVPALRDTGNRLIDPVTGLPVIVLTAKAAKTFLPPGINVDDLSALPSGWWLVRVKTAAGEKTLMCFRPDEIRLWTGKRAWRVEAAAAVSSFQENRALLPEALFRAE